MITDSFLPRSGGIELHVRDLALNLVRSGHDVHVISPFAGDETVGDLGIRQLKVAQWPRFTFAWTPNAVYKLEAQLRDGAYDVAHHHISIFSPFTVASIGLCLQLGIPAVVTGHSLWREYARALGWLDGIFHWSTKPLVTSAVSRAVARDIAPYTGNNPVEHLPNGIDVEFWKARIPDPSRGETRTEISTHRADAVPREGTPVRIVSVLRLARRKRPRVLLDLADRLRKSPPGNMPFVMDIVGAGDERVHLEQIIRERGLENVVRLRGPLTREQIRELFAASDLFILPTAEEAFGIAALEARTAGLPVVAMNTGGVGEIIAHGIEGLLASTDEELVEHTRTLVADSVLREEMASHNRRTRPADGWPQVVALHERVYELADARMRACAGTLR